MQRRDSYEPIFCTLKNQTCYHDCVFHSYLMKSIMFVCRTISTKDYTAFFTFSVKLTLAMQIVGFTVRLSSSLLWIQIYRLGASYVDAASRVADSDSRISFLSPMAPAVVRQCSNSNEILGGSIYDPSYYSSLFEDGQENKYSSEVGLTLPKTIAMITFESVSIRHCAIFLLQYLSYRETILYTLVLGQPVI